MHKAFNSCSFGSFHLKSFHLLNSKSILSVAGFTKFIYIYMKFTLEHIRPDYNCHAFGIGQQAKCTTTNASTVARTRTVHPTEVNPLPCETTCRRPFRPIVDAMAALTSQGRPFQLNRHKTQKPFEC